MPYESPNIVIVPKVSLLSKNKMQNTMDQTVLKKGASDKDAPVSSPLTTTTQNASKVQDRVIVTSEASEEQQKPSNMEPDQTVTKLNTAAIQTNSVSPIESFRKSVSAEDMIKNSGVSWASNYLQSIGQTGANKIILPTNTERVKILTENDSDQQKIKINLLARSKVSEDTNFEPTSEVKFGDSSTGVTDYNKFRSGLPILHNPVPQTWNCYPSCSHNYSTPFTGFQPRMNTRNLFIQQSQTTEIHSPIEYASTNFVPYNYYEYPCSNYYNANQNLLIETACPNNERCSIYPVNNYTSLCTPTEVSEIEQSSQLVTKITELENSNKHETNEVLSLSDNKNNFTSLSNSNIEFLYTPHDDSKLQKTIDSALKKSSITEKANSSKDEVKLNTPRIVSSNKTINKHEKTHKRKRSQSPTKYSKNRSRSEENCSSQRKKIKRSLDIGDKQCHSKRHEHSNKPRSPSPKIKSNTLQNITGTNKLQSKKTRRHSSDLNVEYQSGKRFCNNSRNVTDARYKKTVIKHHSSTDAKHPRVRAPENDNIDKEIKNPRQKSNIDLRSKLSRVNNKYKNTNMPTKHTMSNNFDNLLVTVNRNDDELGQITDTSAPEQSQVSQPGPSKKQKGYKKVQLIINVICKNQDSSNSSSDEEDVNEAEQNSVTIETQTIETQTKLRDLSFLDDINIDDIVNSLKNSTKLEVVNNSNPTVNLVPKSAKTVKKFVQPIIIKQEVNIGGENDDDQTNHEKITAAGEKPNIFVQELNNRMIKEVTNANAFHQDVVAKIKQEICGDIDDQLLQIGAVVDDKQSHIYQALDSPAAEIEQKRSKIMQEFVNNIKCEPSNAADDTLNYDETQIVNNLNEQIAVVLINRETENVKAPVTELQGKEQKENENNLYDNSKAENIANTMNATEIMRSNSITINDVESGSLHTETVIQIFDTSEKEQENSVYPLQMDKNNDVEIVLNPDQHLASDVKETSEINTINKCIVNAEFENKQVIETQQRKLLEIFEDDTAGLSKIRQEMSNSDINHIITKKLQENAISETGQKSKEKNYTPNKEILETSSSPDIQTNLSKPVVQSQNFPANNTQSTPNSIYESNLQTEVKNTVPAKNIQFAPNTIDKSNIQTETEKTTPVKDTQSTPDPIDKSKNQNMGTVTEFQYSHNSVDKPKLHTKAINVAQMKNDASNSDDITKLQNTASLKINETTTNSSDKSKIHTGTENADPVKNTSPMPNPIDISKNKTIAQSTVSVKNIHCAPNAADETKHKTEANNTVSVKNMHLTLNEIDKSKLQTKAKYMPPTNQATKPIETDDDSKAHLVKKQTNIEEKSASNKVNLTKPVKAQPKEKDTKKKTPVASDVSQKISETTRTVAIVPSLNSDKILGLKIEERVMHYMNMKINVTSLLHTGKHSKIFLCKSANGEKLALKHIKNEKNRLKLGMHQEKRWKELLEDIPDQNSNVVKLINGFGLDRTWVFMMEYFPMNLRDALKCTAFDLDTVHNLGKQLVSAVMMLRNVNLVHSDIKPAHVLLDASQKKLKLCGLDDAYYVQELTTVLPNMGTAQYRAPEIILGFSADFAVDVWSTALVIFEMAAGVPLFHNFPKYNNTMLFKQMELLGGLPEDMIYMSQFARLHFIGTTFKRIMGTGKQEYLLYRADSFNNRCRIQNRLFPTIARRQNLRHKDKMKLSDLCRVLEDMLTMDPRRRLPIEFAYVGYFFNEKYCDYTSDM